MSHSRSAAGVWKRDEPHGRLRDATSPQGDVRSKPSKSGGTTRTEGAGGLADPCPAAHEAARQPCVYMRLAGAHVAGGSDESRSGRAWLMSMEGTHWHHAVARGRVLYFDNPKRGSSLLDQRPSVEVNPPDVRPRHASRTPTSETVGHLLAVLEGEAKAKKVGSRADPTTLEEERGKYLADPPRQLAGQGQEVLSGEGQRSTTLSHAGS
jgi:hypothetical protein